MSAARRLRVALSMACLTALVSSAVAQPDEPAAPDAGAAGQPAAPVLAVAPPPVAPALAPGPTTGDPRAWIKPVLTLKGSTSGEGTISAGLDFLVNLGTRDEPSEHDLHVTLLLDAASQDGVSTIVTGQLGALESGGSWTGGLDITYATLRRTPGLGAADLDIPAPDRLRLVGECLSENDPAFRMSWTNASAAVLLPGLPSAANFERVADAIDSADLCASAKRAYTAAVLGKVLPLPSRQISIGGRGGATVLSYLDQTAADVYGFKKDEHFGRWQGGGHYTEYWPSKDATFEAAVRFDQTYKPQKSKARWCMPAGGVVDPTDPMATSPAEQCNEQPLGAPTRQRTLSGAVYGGIVGADAGWRVAAGVTASVSLEGDKPWSVGAEVPLFLVRSSADYSGLVRVTPTLTWTDDGSGTKETKVLVTVSLLGARTLFQTALQ